MDISKTIPHFMIDYYYLYGRRFAWRENRTPFKVYVAEALLQRTRAEQAEEVFSELVKRYKDVSSLLTGFEEACQLMQSLGRFTRLEHIKNGLEYLIEYYNGNFPVDYNNLIKVPSIGPYIAAAIRIFGFEIRDAIIDTNVVRLLGRLYGLNITPETRRKKDFIELAETHVPEHNFIEYSYGILDFAAQVCRAVSPKCYVCDLYQKCSFANKIEQ